VTFEYVGWIVHNLQRLGVTANQVVRFRERHRCGIWVPLPGQYEGFVRVKSQRWFRDIDTNPRKMRIYYLSVATRNRLLAAEYKLRARTEQDQYEKKRLEDQAGACERVAILIQDNLQAMIDSTIQRKQLDTIKMRTRTETATRVEWKAYAYKLSTGERGAEEPPLAARPGKRKEAVRLRSLASRGSASGSS